MSAPRGDKETQAPGIRSFIHSFSQHLIGRDHEQRCAQSVLPGVTLHHHHCVPPTKYVEVLMPVPVNMTVFGNKGFAGDYVKLRPSA